jgi:hypothetical protein
MLRLFQSFFGLESVGRYPESLISKAIERAVDGTDPLLRGLSGYKRKLRPAVLNAIDHVVVLIDGLEPPIVVSELRYDSDPRLKNFFVSTSQMKQVLVADPDLKTCLDDRGFGSREITALLVMQKQEKGIFGADRVGEMIMYDVPQVTVSFSNHQFRDPSADLTETGRLLKRRAFDHLLSLALTNIALVGEKREGLQRRQKLLQAKSNLFKKGNWGFDPAAESKPPDIDDLHAQLQTIEAELLDLGGDDSLFEVNLGLVSDILSQPKNWLWAEKIDLIVDDMGIKRSQSSGLSNRLVLDQVSNAHGRKVVVALVTFPTELLEGL